MQITAKEQLVIENIAINEMNSANWGMPEEAGDTWTWVDCVGDMGYHNLTGWGRALSAVIGSLIKKGLASSNGESLGLTDKGFNVFVKHFDPHPCTVCGTKEDLSYSSNVCRPCRQAAAGPFPTM